MNKSNIAEWLGRFSPVSMSEIPKLGKDYAFEITDNGIDLYTRLKCLNTNIQSLPFKINKAYSDIIITGCNLKSLINFPSEVEGGVVINSNNLETLEHSPKYIKYNFSFNENPISTFKYLPEYVG